MVTKVHHSMIDGMAGVDLMQVLLNLYPTDEIDPIEPWEPRPAPSGTELLVDEAVRFAKLPLRIAKAAAEVVFEGEDARADLRHKFEAAANAARSGWLQRTGQTPMNEALSPHRHFEWLTVDLDQVKDIKNRLGGTVNDVVLATVAGAVRSFIMERGVEVEDIEYRVMVPVSIRTDEHVGQLGNQVAMWLVELPIAEPDPVKRLAAVRTTIADLKGSDAALGATVLTQAGAWMPLNLLSLGVRWVYAAARPFNMTVTNVPGPQIPIYLLGAKLLANYPMVPLYMDHGIGVALFSYDGDINWGLVADYDLVPDLDRFAAAISGAIDDLATAADRVAVAEERKAHRAATRASRPRPGLPPNGSSANPSEQPAAAATGDDE
jgi:WS/DGAT/MGAT family acyltransferase